MRTHGPAVYEDVGVAGDLLRYLDDLAVSDHDSAVATPSARTSPRV